MAAVQNMEKARKHFEKVAFQYIGSLYNTALRMTGDEADAQDLIQSTYLRAYRSFDKAAGTTDFKILMFEILKNLYMNKYHRETAHPINNLDKEDLIFREDISDRINSETIMEAVDDLPNGLRLAIILADTEGFSYAEISKIFNIPIDTVISKLSIGRKLLRKHLWKKLASI